MTCSVFPLVATVKEVASRLSGMQRLVNQGNGIATGAPGHTRAALHQLPAGAIGIQFELANILTDSSVTYNAVYALSAGVNDWFTPLNASGVPDNTLWKKVTAVASTSMTVAAAVSANRPERLLTDIMPFTCIPPARIDGGSGICLFFRICSTVGGVTHHGFDGTIGNWNGYHNGQHPEQFSQTFGGGWWNSANNCIEGNYEVPYRSDNLAPTTVPHAVLPVMGMPTLTIMSVGDSILSGVGSRGPVDAGINGAGLQLAKLLNRRGRPVFHVNDATSGMNSADFVANATNSLAVMVPDVILLQTWSANDPEAATTHGVWTAWQRAMAFAAMASALGSRVVLVTSPPFCGIGSSRDSRLWAVPRSYANSLIAGAGMPFVDTDAVLGAGLNPAGFRPGCSDDLVHPNDLASSLLASAGAVALSAYGIR